MRLRLLDPLGELTVRLEGQRTHEDIATHRPAREIHDPDVRPGKRSVVSVWSYPRQQLIAEHAAEHLPVDHERETTEHGPLSDTRVSCDNPSNAGSELGVVCHGDPWTRCRDSSATPE